MKKLSIVLMGVFIFFSMAHCVFAIGIFTKDLRYGLKNNAAVRDLQQFLKDQGDFTADVTGNFYSVTQAAVKKFQQEQGIKVTGVFDKTTRDRANELAGFSDPASSSNLDAVIVPQNVPSSVSASSPATISLPNSSAAGRKTRCLDVVNAQFPLSTNAHLTTANAEADLTTKKIEYQNCLATSGNNSAVCQAVLQQVLDKASVVNQLLQSPTADKPGTTMADYERVLAVCNQF